MLSDRSLPVLIDVTRLLIRLLAGRLPTGVDRVSLAYVQHFKCHAHAAIIHGKYSWVFSRRDSERLFETLLNPGADAAWSIRKMIVKSFLAEWARLSTGPCFLLNTGHRGLERDDYAVSLRRRGAQLICLVHDLIPITHSEYCRAGEHMRHHMRMGNALALSSGILTNSQDTLDVLCSAASLSGWQIPPAVAVPLAPGHIQSAPGHRPIAPPYFVMVGTIEARKNHLLMLQVWRQLVAQMGEQAPRLVIIGQRGWEIENVLDLLERCEALRGYVFEQSACTDAQLVTYLHHAQALLFPSFVEGYGMPLIEALSLGVPVIASDLPVFHEIAAEVPEYADPLDGPQWLRLIADYMAANSTRRQAQLERMASFQPPTWSQHFEMVDAFLERLGEQLKN